MLASDTRSSPSRRPGGLGVEHRRRFQPDLAQAGQVLAGGVQHPLGVADRVLQRRQRRGHGSRLRIRPPRIAVGRPALNGIGSMRMLPEPTRASWIRYARWL